MGRFSEAIQGKKVIRDVEDKVYWKENKNENFTVKSIYDVLDPRNAVLFPYTNIWSPCVFQGQFFLFEKLGGARF